MNSFKRIVSSQKNNKMDNLQDFTKKKIKQIFEENKDKNVSFESDLLNEMRNFAKKQYFLPFLEQFIIEIKSYGKTISSKHILKLLLKEESNLFNRDQLGICGNSYSYEKKEIIMLNEKYDYFIEKGILIDLIDNLKLLKTLEYIKKELIKKYPKGIPDGEIIYIFENLDLKKVSDLIDEDFEHKKSNKLFL